MSLKIRIRFRTLLGCAAVVALLAPVRNGIITDVPGFGYPLPLYISWPRTECMQDDYPASSNPGDLCFDLSVWVGAWWALSYAIISIRLRKSTENHSITS